MENKEVVQAGGLNRAHTKALQTHRDMDYYIEGGLFNVWGWGVRGGCNLCEQGTAVVPIVVQWELLCSSVGLYHRVKSPLVCMYVHDDDFIIQPTSETTTD